MSEEDPKPKPPAAPPAAPPTAPKAPAKAPPPKAAAAPKPAPPPTPKTSAGRAALEQHRAKAGDWDAIAGAAIKASGLEAELQALRARNQRLAEAGHQVCDSVLPLFAALAQEQFP